MKDLEKMRAAGEALEAASTEFSAAVIDFRAPSKFLAAKEAVVQAHIDWVEAVSEVYMANVAARVEGLR